MTRGAVPERAVATDEHPRQAWMDNLRITLISGVVVAHAATAYVVDVGWYYEERTGSTAFSTALSFPVFLGGVFGLGPLFVMAGWLSAGSLRRRGAGGFVRARLVRLGVPLVLFLAVVDPVTDWMGGTAQGENRSLRSYLTDLGGDRDVGPMWFVAAILVLSVLYTGYRAVRPENPHTGGEMHLRHLAAIAATIAVLAFVTWQRWGYLTDTWWDLNWSHWPQAGALFVLGVLAGERGWLRQVPRPLEREAGWVTVAGLAAVIALAGYVLAAFESDVMTVGLHWQTAVFAAVTGCVAVASCVWVIAWFERRWNGEPSAMTSAAARGSYAAYVLHPPLLVLLSWLLVAVPVPVEVKFVLVAAAGIPLCFAVGYGVTRLPGVSRVL